MAKTICLVTYELAPINRGGAGVVISALAEALAGAGNAVHVLADMPPTEVDQYTEHLAKRGVERVTAHALTSLVPHGPGGSTVFQAKSAQFRAGLYRLAERIHFDVVEFFEYAGVGFDTLSLREPDDRLAGTELVVRIHGSLGMIDHVEAATHVSLERHTMYLMETWAMRLADAVIAPLQSIGEQYEQIYGFEPGRLRVCPPPMETLLAEVGQPVEREEDPRDVVFYGKLQAVKGCDVFVEAALLLADARPQLRFVLVGPDTSDGMGSMRARLDGLIPAALRTRFRFVSHIQRTELGGLVARALCAVVPSRAESFCLAAHELHRVGVPLVLSDVVAFRDAFTDNETCLKFDGTATDLAVQLERLALDAGLTKKLARAGRSMRYAEVAEAYIGPSARRNEVPHGASFARREVASLGFWANEQASRLERIAQLERALEDVRGSKGWRLVAATRELRERVRSPVRTLVNKIRSST